MAADKAAAAPQWAFRIQFTDKTGAPPLAGPSAFLSTRALQRRTAQGIAVTENDRPVSPVYLTDALAATSGKLHVTSRWFNQCVLLLADSAQILQLQGKAYVAGIEYLGYLSTALHRGVPGTGSASPVTEGPVARGTGAAIYYGNTWNQTSMVNGDFLHDQGFKGAGQLIAVLDYGFDGVDTHPGFDSLRQQGRIVDTYNFVNATNDIYSSGWDHGTSSLSTMAGLAPGTFVGSAPYAQYALYLTDANNPQYNDALFDLDGFVGALERADSIGADVITSSLGYNYFNHPKTDTFTKAQLDGHTTLVAKAENIAAAKGIFVIASAGNEGGNSWNFLLTPGDADSALTVGAAEPNRATAGFSSPGPNSSGRIKPDVILQGSPAAVFNSASYTFSSGTSFSTPQLAGWAACVRQSKPSVSPYLLKQAINGSGDRAGAPTAKEGYGIPDFKKVLASVGIAAMPASRQELVVTPNPFLSSLTLQYSSTKNAVLQCTLTDASGRLVAARKFDVAAGTNSLQWELPLSLPSGNYFLEASGDGKAATHKLTKR